MNTGEKLVKQLKKILSGEPWYGPNVYHTLEKISFEVAYEKPQGSVHNIAGILLHMVAWTEEVMDRMNGLTAGNPSSGDWPETGAPEERKWQHYVEDLKLVNVNLIGLIQNFPEEQWDEQIDDKRGNKPVATYKEMVQGLIQHHIYHLGQITLLLRITQVGE